MGNLCAATWFLFLHVVWPTYDTYCDIGLALYCLSHGVRLWGVVMTLPILSTFCTSLAAYLRKRRTGDVQSGTVWSGEGLALPLLIWPQVCPLCLIYNRSFTDMTAGGFSWNQKQKLML